MLGTIFILCTMYPKYFYNSYISSLYSFMIGKYVENLYQGDVLPGNLTFLISLPKLLGTNPPSKIRWPLLFGRFNVIGFLLLFWRSSWPLGLLLFLPLPCAWGRHWQVAHNNSNKVNENIDKLFVIKWVATNIIYVS